jgi:hypothetical protein
MIERGQPREVPPESQTMGDSGISVLFSMPGCGCGRNTGMVFPH